MIYQAVCSLMFCDIWPHNTIDDWLRYEFTVALIFLWGCLDYSDCCFSSWDSALVLIIGKRDWDKVAPLSRLMLFTNRLWFALWEVWILSYEKWKSWSRFLYWVKWIIQLWIARLCVIVWYWHGSQIILWDADGDINY